jgi:hypothetical protein
MGGVLRRAATPLLLVLALSASGCARPRASLDALPSATPTSGPVLASWGRHVVLAWTTNRPDRLHWAVSVDGGRHFTAARTASLDAPPGHTLLAAVRLVADAGARAYVSEGAIGVRLPGEAPRVVLHLRDGAEQPLPAPADLAEALAADAWDIEPLARGADRLYAVTTPQAFGVQQHLPLVPPATASATGPVVTVDGHGALAVVWHEQLPDRMQPSLVVRRYAGRSVNGAAAQTFDVAQVAADAPADVTAAVAAVPTGVVVAWYADGAVRHRVLMLDLLCAPPGGDAVLSRPAALLQRNPS